MDGAGGEGGWRGGGGGNERASWPARSLARPPTYVPLRPLPAQGCYAAFQRAPNATHLVSCVPGAQAITDKGRLGASLVAAYGREGALGLAPPSFGLPGEYARLVQRARQVGGAGGQAAGRLHCTLDQSVRAGASQRG